MALSPSQMITLLSQSRARLVVFNRKIDRKVYGEVYTDVETIVKYLEDVVEKLGGQAAETNV
jgi:hypothetical protein